MALPTEPRLPAGRPICSACRRPEGLCYCAHLPHLPTRTKVVLLQHSRERDVAIGTARMVRLCLPNAELHVGVRWDDSAALAKAISDPAAPAILLYPGPGARDVLTDPPKGPVTLVVVDGTWSNARNLVRDNAVLAALPRYAFTPPNPSEYRIRREPSETCVSTIEAVALVLGALEGDPKKFSSMLEPFRAMVDAHLHARATRLGRDTPRRKQRERRPITAPDLELMRAHPERLVCITAEANAWRYAEGGSRDNDELVHVVVHRVATGESLDLLACPSRGLSPSTPFHLQLDADELLAGMPIPELLQKLLAFSRPDDIWCGWGYFSHNITMSSGGPTPSNYLDLRALAQRLGRGERVGMLEEYCPRTVSKRGPAIGRGRAGKRTAMLTDLVHHWLAPSLTSSVDDVATADSE